MSRSNEDGAELRLSLDKFGDGEQDKSDVVAGT